MGVVVFEESFQEWACLEEALVANNLGLSKESRSQTLVFLEPPLPGLLIEFSGWVGPLRQKPRGLELLVSVLFFQVTPINERSDVVN